MAIKPETIPIPNQPNTPLKWFLSAQNEFIWKKLPTDKKAKDAINANHVFAVIKLVVSEE